MSKQVTIESVRTEFRTDSKLVAKNPEKHESLKIKFLGRKGLVAKLFSQLSKVSDKDRPKHGKDLNNLKYEISSFFDKNKKIRQVVVRDQQIAHYLALSLKLDTSIRFKKH